MAEELELKFFAATTGVTHKKNDELRKAILAKEHLNNVYPVRHFCAQDVLWALVK